MAHGQCRPFPGNSPAEPREGATGSAAPGHPPPGGPCRAGNGIRSRRTDPCCQLAWHKIEGRHVQGAHIEGVHTSRVRTHRGYTHIEGAHIEDVHTSRVHTHRGCTDIEGAHTSRVHTHQGCTCREDMHIVVLSLGRHRQHVAPGKLLLV